MILFQIAHRQGTLINFWDNIIIWKKNIAEKIYFNVDNSNSSRPSKMTMPLALKMLLSTKILEEDLFKEINEIRQYSNSVVHSKNPEISIDADRRAEYLNNKVELIKKDFETNKREFQDK